MFGFDLFEIILILVSVMLFLKPEEIARYSKLWRHTYDRIQGELIEIYDKNCDLYEKNEQKQHNTAQKTYKVRRNGHKSHIFIERDLKKYLYKIQKEHYDPW